MGRVGGAELIDVNTVGSHGIGDSEMSRVTLADHRDVAGVEPDPKQGAQHRMRRLQQMLCGDDDNAVQAATPTRHDRVD